MRRFARPPSRDDTAAHLDVLRRLRDGTLRLDELPREPNGDIRFGRYAIAPDIARLLQRIVSASPEELAGIDREIAELALDDLTKLRLRGLIADRIRGRATIDESAGEAAGVYADDTLRGFDSDLIQLEEIFRRIAGLGGALAGRGRPGGRMPGGGRPPGSERMAAEIDRIVRNNTQANGQPRSRVATSPNERQRRIDEFNSLRRFADLRHSGFADEARLRDHVSRHTRELGITATGSAAEAEYLRRARDLLRRPIGNGIEGAIRHNGDILVFNRNTGEMAAMTRRGEIRTYRIYVPGSVDGSRQQWDRELAHPETMRAIQ